MAHCYIIFGEHGVHLWAGTVINLGARGFCFSLSELSDSFSFLFLYYNGHASILIDQLSQRNVTVHKLQ